MKKIMLFASFIVFVCLFSFSASAEKVLSKAWHEYNDVFTVDGKVIDIRLGESADSLLRVKVDNISGLLALKECTLFDTHTVCYLNRSLDVEQSTISTTGKTMPGVYLSVSKEDDILTDLTITPTLGKFNIFEEYQVNVTFMNKKSVWINPFKYDLILPKDVVLVDSGDFVNLGSNKISYTGSLSSNSLKIVSFKVMSSTTGLKKVNYTISSSSDGISKEAKGTFNFDFVNPYTITVTVPSTSMNVLDDTKLVINVKNTGNFDLELTNLTIQGISTGELDYFGGRGLDVIRPGFYSTVQSEIFKKGIDKEYYMIITPISTGKYNLTITANMKYNGKPIVYVLNKTLISSVSGIVPVFDLSKDAVLSGAEVEVYYEISNTNPSNIFKNISVDISGEFVSEKLSLDKLGASESKVLLRKFISAPFVDKDQTYKILAVTNYITWAGEKKQVNTTKTLRVTSNGSLISVTQKVSPKEVYAGQEVIVEITLKNLKDEVFEIGASESAPDGIEKMGGIVKRNLTLRGLGSDSAYVYKLHVPLETTLTGFNLTTTARVESKNYETSVSSYIKIKKNLTANISTTKVNASKGDIDIKDIDVIKKNSSLSSNSTKPQAQVKKDTAFRRFFKSVETFFTNLFN